MEDMQAVYDDEINRGSGGLLSLLRAPADIGIDPSVMDNLPDILTAFEKSSALEKAIRRGGTGQEMLKMEIESIDARDPDDSSFSARLAATPGIMQLLEQTGTAGEVGGLVLGAMIGVGLDLGFGVVIGVGLDSIFSIVLNVFAVNAAVNSASNNL